MLACLVGLAAAAVEEQPGAAEQPRQGLVEQPQQYYYPSQPYPYLQNRNAVG